MMMHKAVRSLSSTPSDKSSQPDRTLPLIEGGYSMQTAEALLSLIGLLVASTSGCTALSEVQSVL